jgi:hypothetical protein
VPELVIVPPVIFASSQMVEPFRALIVPPVLLNGAAPIRLIVLPDCARMVPVLVRPAPDGWILSVHPLAVMVL